MEVTWDDMGTVIPCMPYHVLLVCHDFTCRFYLLSKAYNSPFVLAKTSLTETWISCSSKKYPAICYIHLKKNNIGETLCWCRVFSSNDIRLMITIKALCFVQRADVSTTKTRRQYRNIWSIKNMGTSLTFQVFSVFFNYASVDLWKSMFFFLVSSKRFGFL